MSGRDHSWWRQDDQFHWFSAYLHDRGLDRQWRLATFAFTVVFAAVPMVMLVSPLGPGTAAARGVAVGVALAGVAAGSVWLIGWPTRTRSLIFHAVCSASIATGCLTLSTAYGGLMGCAMFTAIGGLLAYFHALVHVLANFVVASTCAAISAVRLFTETGDAALVGASLLVVLGLNLGVPFGIHALVHSLHSDLRFADRDPLTGLLNRRAFANSVHEMVLQRRGAPLPLQVTMIDIDGFKRLNDTRGHAAGDQALVAIAAVLRQQCGPDAAVGRLGGEEFVIAEVAPAPEHALVAERIRAGIAALPARITASLGTCAAVLDTRTESDFAAVLDHVIAVADTAMYRSKRAGGNRVHVSAWWACSDARSTSPLP
ncbi:diguanylate cyclase [Mycolicibacterium bacteremicum]|uniref:GGDEF domain-containing protein n=1 Tax=Mycolicibacterium bacteremicum TaxID=564198 RepID=UPI0026EB7E0D|nr:GGDEF domain-containing protein [Mycolicibacterium bacteremicum]